jgi:hypothetical protein
MVLKPRDPPLPVLEALSAIVTPTTVLKVSLITVTPFFLNKKLWGTFPV